MTLICTSCHDSFNDKKLFCHNCGKVCAIKLGNEFSYFEIFDLKPSLDIDQTMLEMKFAELVNIMHPDRFLYKTEDEKLIAEVNTATIYKAYHALSSDLGICEYILSSTEYADNNEILDDADDFLMEKMELYDELNNINSLNKCNEFRKRLNSIYSSKLSMLKNNITQKNFHNQNKELQKLKFIQHLIDALEKKVYMLEIDIKLQ